MILLFDNGFRVHDFVGRVTSPKRHERGAVKGFSNHSRLRLREFLLSHHVSGCCPYGVCLTIPSQDDISVAVEKFAVAVHRLRTYFVRQYPFFGYVWRVELQSKTRMPHLHLVAWFPHCYNVSDVFLSLWRDIVCKLYSVSSFSSFLAHGVKVDKLDGNIRAYRYICDHSGKRKQAQLGFVGRQWGVVGRKNFSLRDFVNVDVPFCLRLSFNRMVRRVMSFSVKCPCVFGSKVVRRNRVNAVSYISRHSVLRWLSFASSQLHFCNCIRFVYEDMSLPF